jgi:RimJ/RimL family protein N-acetyltransferase
MSTCSTGFEVIRDSRAQDVAWRDMTWPPASGVVLAGKTVVLSPCLPDVDAPPLFDALNDDRVWVHLAGRPRSPELFAGVLKQRLAEGRFVWMVRLAEAYAGLAPGTVVGTSSYLEVSTKDARLEIGSTAYHPDVWSSLVNPEAKLLLLGHAFEVLGVGRVQLRTDVRNQRSQRAIARLGARYEGTLRRFNRRDDGTVRDTVVFSIIAEEWPAVQERLVTRLQCHEVARAPA